MCISGIYAFTNTPILKVKNEVNTGAISIELKEYTIVDGQELIYNDTETTVLPGQIISLIPRVTNVGDSSYIRAKLSYTSEDNSLIQISDDNVDGMSENWIKKGEYWYYKNTVNSGENLDIFNSFRIPVDVPNEFQGNSIFLNIAVEAVQASNFTPDFNSQNPWNGINVEEANTTYHADMVQINPNAVIEYDNSANLYMNVPEDFFSKLGHVVPGDIIKDEVTIKNTKKANMEYFISTEKVDGISEKGMELLEKLQLKIQSKDKVLYEGKAYKLENKSLGVYKPDDSAKLEFIITVPTELGNEFADLSSAIRWNFSVEEGKEEPTPEPEPEPIPEPEKTPQTGDTKFKVAITTFFISTLGLIIVLVLDRKQKNKRV